MADLWNNSEVSQSNNTKENNELKFLSLVLISDDTVLRMEVNNQQQRMLNH